jgi:Transposase DDE domain
VVPEQPAGRVNVTDRDARPVKTTRGFIQGYSAQAAATEDQIIVMRPTARHDAARRRAGRPAPLAAELRARLDSAEGRGLYRKRQRIIEPIFGQTKANRGIDRFLCRGLGACRAEWSLITATHNLLKAWRRGLAVA